MTPQAKDGLTSALETLHALHALQVVRNHAREIARSCVNGDYGDLPPELVEAMTEMLDRIDAAN